jgi:GT2 family glycosyltransferase/glycosyltransferase involved in cell wall biosynthesis
MSLHRLSPHDSVPTERERPAVCIPVYGAYGLFVECLRSVLSHTDASVPVLVADDSSPDPAIERFLYDLDASGALLHEVFYLRQPQNLGFVGNVNVAFDCISPADPVLLNSDCLVAEGWLEALRAAAYSDSRIATASTLTNHGTILSVPYRNSPQPELPQDWKVGQAAVAIKEASLQLRPRIPTAIAHCVYIRRAALDLVGNFDEAFSPGYGEEVDFSQRCLLQGLSHVVADDVFVFHRGKASFSSESDTVQEQHEAINRRRYPYYARSVHDAEHVTAGPLPRALGAARRAIRGPSVTIDARILGPHLTGTQVVVLELLHALWRMRSLRLRIIVPPDLGDYAHRLLDEMPDVERLTVDDVPEPTDVVHRPFQVSTHEDVHVLRRFGERLVISQLDLIAYQNPGYFAHYESWDRYRRLTRQALAFADNVIFISHAAARDALAEDLVDPKHMAVVYLGTDHRLTALQPEPQPPAALDGSLRQRYLLCLGTDYRHKNRLFALRLFEQLQRRHEWRGSLVFAGAHVPYGSSAAEEAEFLACRPEVAQAVTDLPAVTEAEKAWLLEHAAAVVYPTLHEGFGLMPFEAAQAGVPCLFASQSSLAEVLPSEAARIVPWDAVASADAAVPVLEGRAAKDVVEEILAVAARYSWDQAGAEVREIYEETARRPARESLLLAQDMWRLEERYEGLREALGEEGLSLIGPGGVIPPSLRRPLLAVAARQWLRLPYFGLLRLTYGIAYRLLHGGRGPKTSRA